MLYDVLRELRPDGVFLCASRQSPWERTTDPSPWTEFVQHAGYGVTVPLQAQFALAVGRAVDRLGARGESGGRGRAPWFVNACLPDIVNPLITALDVPVLCGIGNVAILAAFLQAATGAPDQKELKLLAHHYHLHAPHDPAEEALAWQGETALPEVGALLAAGRRVERRELNQVTGLGAATLITDLLTGAERATHLPGPAGLPGGYPVLVRDGEVSLRLPAELDREAAIAANRRASALDGAVLDGKHLTFSPAASAALRPLAPELADGFGVDRLDTACEQLAGLRARLRT
ncbi:potassium transporter TrkA [Catenulispora rubra]|uniref:potassium transporter TrkA n=1 Tax=Catenulispora rubra TaxID=280293 RepID=UPI001892709D|nr:potassium transporter TrkA [Catenulispora rubra]